MTDTPEQGPRWRWSAVAFLLFGLALALRFQVLGGEDLTEVVPARQVTKPAMMMVRVDSRFVVWLVARNAHTLLHDPARFFDAGICYPAEQALAFGEPGITLGLMGMSAPDQM